MKRWFKYWWPIIIVVIIIVTMILVASYRDCNAAELIYHDDYVLVEEDWKCDLWADTCSYYYRGELVDGGCPYCLHHSRDTTRYVREKAGPGRLPFHAFPGNADTIPEPDTVVVRAVGLRNWCKKEIKKITEPDLMIFQGHMGWTEEYLQMVSDAVWPIEKPGPTHLFVDTVITYRLDDCITYATYPTTTECDTISCDTLYDTTFVYPWEE